MQRRRFIRLVGGGAVSAAAVVSSAGMAGCSSSMPAEAIEAWQGPASALAADGDMRRWLLSYAILAPHSHNLQSWIADLGTPGEISLYCDLHRLLPQTDPLSRQIMMSHGAFLELLDLSARERGLRAEISLFPQGSFGPEKLDTRPVAQVRLTPDARRRRQQRPAVCANPQTPYESQWLRHRPCRAKSRLGCNGHQRGPLHRAIGGGWTGAARDSGCAPCHCCRGLAHRAHDTAHRHGVL